MTGIEGAVACVERARSLDRRRCRQQFERRLRAARMARDECCPYHHCEAQ